jgi:threonine dehydrogenase-like Zn-dependent dehydrogenase
MQMTISALHFKQICLITTRAYQKKDYEEALQLLTSKEIDGDTLISDTILLTELPETLDSLAKAVDIVKVMVDCSL